MTRLGRMWESWRLMHGGMVRAFHSTWFIGLNLYYYREDRPDGGSVG